MGPGVRHVRARGPCFSRPAPAPLRGRVASSQSPTHVAPADCAQVMPSSDVTEATSLPDAPASLYAAPRARRTGSAPPLIVLGALVGGFVVAIGLTLRQKASAAFTLVQDEGIA